MKQLENNRINKQPDLQGDTQIRFISGDTVKLLLNGSDIGEEPLVQEEIYIRFGFDYKKPPNSYPQSDYLKIVEFIRELKFQQESSEEAYEKMGYGIVQAYFKTSVGQVVQLLAGVMGPFAGARSFVKAMQQTLPWASHQYIVSNGYFRYTIEFLPGPPGLMRGILKAALEAGGAKLKRLSSKTTGMEEVVYEVEWFVSCNKSY